MPVRSLTPTDYGSGNFDLPDELLPYFYGAGADYGMDESKVPGPPPVPPRSRYRQDLEEAIANPPQMPEATWGRGLLSGLIGGMSGYLNASPSRQFRIDPTQTIERIRYGDYPQKLSEWQQRLKGLQSLEELQRGDIEEARKRDESQSLINQRNATADYYKTGRAAIEDKKIEGQNYRAGMRTDTQRLNSTIPITEARSEYIKEMLADERITPEQAQDPNYRVSAKGYHDWLYRQTAEDQVALKRELSEAHELNATEIAKLRTDASRYRTEKQYEAAMARVEEMRKRTSIMAEKAATTGNKTDDEAVKEYRGNNEKAETNYLDNINKLNRRFRIGAGTEFSAGVDAPEKLPAEQRKQYFSEMFRIEQRLVNAKKSAERLYSFKTRKDPDFTEIEAPHLDNLARYQELSMNEGAAPAGASGAPAAAPKPSIPSPTTKPAAAPAPAKGAPAGRRGIIKESSILNKFGRANLAAKIAEAERAGYTVLRGQ